MRTLGALLLLLAGLAWNNAWKWFPPDLQGWAYNASTGAFVTILLLIVFLFTSTVVRVVCVLLIGFSVQVAVCNGLYVIDPWPLVEGGEMCSTRLAFPLGLAGLWVASLVAHWLYMKGRNRG